MASTPEQPITAAAVPGATTIGARRPSAIENTATALPIRGLRITLISATTSGRAKSPVHERDATIGAAEVPASSGEAHRPVALWRAPRQAHHSRPSVAHTERGE